MTKQLYEDHNSEQRADFDYEEPDKLLTILFLQLKDHHSSENCMKISLWQNKINKMKQTKGIKTQLDILAK